MFSIGILGFLVWSHHMFSVGLDVDTNALVFTELHLFKIKSNSFLYEQWLNFNSEWEKILLCAGNSSISSPLAFIALGKIYLQNLKLSGQSAGNFSISTKATARTKNTYNSYSSLPKIVLSRNPLFKINQKYYLRPYSTDFTKQSQINPHFISGLIDAEGGFVIRVRKNSKSKLGWYVEPIFAIGLHQKDIAVLNILQNYFGGVGKISLSKDLVLYCVSSLRDLTNIILPHFLKYPLITQKKADFILFKDVIDLMSHKEHLILEGLKKIVSIKASINRGLPEELITAFPEIDAIKRPLIQDQKIIDPYWASGFVSGDGCFRVNMFKSSNKSGKTVRTIFTITQHTRDEPLMRSLEDYFGCGSVFKSRMAVDYIVSKIDDITNKIIPFFDQYNLVGIKSQDFQDFKKVAILIKNGDHLTAEGVNHITNIKSGMNKGRVSYKSNMIGPLSSSLPSNSNNIFRSRRDFSTSHRTSTLRNKFKHADFTKLRKISEHVPKHNDVPDLTDQDFGYFLAGLIEGDGWFGFNQLHIVFSERDISLAYSIKKRIGYGNVYKIKDKKAVRYICKNKIGLSIILSLINGKFLSTFKYEQLIKHNYNKTFNFEILPPSNSISLDNYWLAGFTQADGCFHINIAKSKTHKTGFSVRLEFSIKQNDV